MHASMLRLSAFSDPIEISEDDCVLSRFPVFLGDNPTPVGAVLSCWGSTDDETYTAVELADGDTVAVLEGFALRPETTLRMLAAALSG